jgi:hypothetical protein
MMMEAASTSKTSVNFYQTTRRNNPEDSHINFKCNLISNMCARFPTHLILLDLITLILQIMQFLCVYFITSANLKS